MERNSAQLEFPAEEEENDAQSTVRGPDLKLRGRIRLSPMKESVKQTEKEPLPKLWWRIQLPPT